MLLLTVKVDIVNIDLLAITKIYEFVYLKNLTTEQLEIRVLNIRYSIDVNNVSNYRKCIYSALLYSLNNNISANSARHIGSILSFLTSKILINNVGLLYLTGEDSRGDHGLGRLV